MPKTRNAFAFRIVDYIKELDERIKESREKGDIELADELKEQADTLLFGVFEPKEIEEPFQRDRIREIERCMVSCEKSIKKGKFLLCRFGVHIKRLQSLVAKYGASHDVGIRAKILLEKYVGIRQDAFDYLELMSNLKKYNQETLRNAFNEELGNRLRLARKKAGLTQDDVALRLGITKSSYSHYELGRREIPPLLIYQLTNLLNVSAEYLLGTEIKR